MPTAIFAPMRREPALLALLATAAPFAIFHGDWLAELSNPVWAGSLFVWLFGAIAWGAKGLVQHGERLAHLTGEPVGTLILTLAVTGIEVLTIAVVLKTGDNNPTLARDTIFSVTMIVLNGLVGLALLLGGWRHREQEYNLRGVNAFLSLILALAVFILILPNFTASSDGPTFNKVQEKFLIVMCLGLYGVFLAVQTTRHRGYFTLPGVQTECDRPVGSILAEAALLLAHLAPILFLVEHLGVVLNHGIEVLGAPPVLGGLVIAVMVLFPEGLAAVRAALANHLQRAINILLGSVLATLALTAPAVVIIGLVRRTPVVLGLDGVDQPLLVLTLLLSTITFASGRTNILQGAVHLMLFFAYLMLLIWN
jgi:Ca2+:H+ antiporter